MSILPQTKTKFSDFIAKTEGGFGADSVEAFVESTL